MSTLLTMFLWTLMGALTGYFASQRGRDPYIWFALGIFFGIFALLVLILLPPIRSEEEINADKRNKEIVERREKQVEEVEKIENAPDLQPQSIETKEWFYLDKEYKQQGPISFYVLSELWQGEDLNAQSLVWTEGMAEWKKIEEIPDLAMVLDGTRGGEES